jgi:hypothetical protein
MLLRWRLRERRGGERKNECEQNFHGPKDSVRSSRYATAVLGSARLWRAGRRILRRRTLSLLSSTRVATSSKVRDRKMRSPARCKRALPGTRRTRRAHESR